ncbi:SGNH/GDSL hydrolase family protein [Paenibacillus sp. FSL R10-2734]|uniref:SGNH/GDSL hydrolase family protein n=1 Tax=Paenibacillus sp. FSL R10-2734 TaxID=2954691 RepID=UPI0030DA0ED9
MAQGQRLEQYEWCQMWREEADKQDLPRILLIGDSITNGYHPFVQEQLRGLAYVDKLVTSKAIDNAVLLKEIDYMLMHGEDYVYQIIHFNNGLHGWHVPLEEYKESLDSVIQYIQSLSKAKIVVATSTQVTTKGEHGKIDHDKNDRVIDRNRAASEVAVKHGLTITDLYTPMYGRSDYRVADPEDLYHFNEQGQRAQAVLVSAILKQFLSS